MTKKEAAKEFEDTVLGSINPNDDPALDQAWNDFTDALCKERRITSNQYSSWTHPKFSKVARLKARARYHRKNGGYDGEG